MKTTNKRYEAPKAEIIEIESQGILCASAGGPSGTPGAPGAGLNGMNNGGTHGW